MREMGPLTCVIAWVVWSASQSTVPGGVDRDGPGSLADGAGLEMRQLLRGQGKHPGLHSGFGLGFALHLLDHAACRLRKAEQKRQECRRQRTTTKARGLYAHG